VRGVQLRQHQGGGEPGSNGRANICELLQRRYSRRVKGADRPDQNGEGAGTVAMISTVVGRCLPGVRAEPAPFMAFTGNRVSP